MLSPHVFVTLADLTHFQCDAWMLPTDAALGVTEVWRDAVAAFGDPLPIEMPEGFGIDGSRNLASPVVGSSAPVIVATAVPLWKLAPEDHLAHVTRAVHDFVATAVAALHKRQSDQRSRIVLGMPSFSTGAGGADMDRGRVLRAILAAAASAAQAHSTEDCVVDVAVILRSEATYALAQRDRRKARDTWATLSDELQQTADRLAVHARAGRLVPFMGAGVSISAGAPTWPKLIEQLATGLGLPTAEAEVLTGGAHGPLDQAAILRALYDRRGGATGATFEDVVVGAVERHLYGLAPSLLASLRTPQAITLNYDTLFERASEDAGMPRKVFPHRTGVASDAWLLKLHGSVDAPGSIVLTREDYLGFAAERNALSAMVKANLVTHHLLFVGFGLTDDHFHEIVHDVRRALPSGSAEATALTFREDPFAQHLWPSSMKLISVAGADDEPQDVTGRRLEILLDMVAAHTSDGHAYLLAEGFESALDPAERAMRERLLALSQVGQDIKDLPEWRSVERFLDTFGRQVG